MTARRGAEIALGLAMAAAIGLIVHATNGQGFAIDELYYYGRVALKEGALIHYASPFSPEYLLAPFNGHLALGGRFVYETVFATVGAHYTVFVVINALGICAAAGLLFVFARRRIGDVAALAPALLILFFGIAREQFLWPLDFNTSVALAAGLAAILCLQREDRRADLAACLLLAVSAAMIEVGLAFLVGTALLIALDRDRLRRAWIVVAPLVLYAAWWVWSARFDQGETELSNIVDAPKTAFDSIAVSLGALTGTNSPIPASFGTDLTTLGKVLAVIALVALVARIVRGGLPRTIWVWLVVAGTYWTLLAVAARSPQSTRYLLVSAVLVLLIAADCFRRPLSNRIGAVAGGPGAAAAAGQHRRDLDRQRRKRPAHRHPQDPGRVRDGGAGGPAGRPGLRRLGRPPGRRTGRRPLPGDPRRGDPRRRRAERLDRLQPRRAGGTAGGNPRDRRRGPGRRDPGRTRTVPHARSQP